MEKTVSEQVEPGIKSTKKDVDIAFDELANFLLEQYRKYKEVQETDLT